MNVPHPTEGAILEYSRRLKKLHEFIREGEGDSEKADALRDEMDDSYFQLTPEEIEQLESLSADLYILGENGPLSGDRPTDGAIRRQMLVAGRADDWAELRSLLDSDANSADLFDRILFRAIYRAAMEDYDSSLEFLRHQAKRVDEERAGIEMTQSGLSRLARVGRAAGEIAVVQEVGRLILERLALVAEELGRLISEIEAMRSSVIVPDLNPTPWNAIKERFLALDAPFRAISERAA